MESTKEIHHVCSLQEGHPNQVLVPAGTVGDCGEAYLGAQSGEEYMLVDKKNNLLPVQHLVGVQA